MALLVCYSDSLADHPQDKAIYLDQQFYGMIFHHCRGESSGFDLLRQIALLRYKSPTILLPAEQLPALAAELDVLEHDNRKHSQLRAFKTVCRNAVQNGINLTISGDMHPELDDNSPRRFWLKLKHWIGIAR